MPRIVVVALVPVLLAACAPTQLTRIEPLDGTMSGQCHVDAVRGVVGLAAGPNTVERARVDSDSLHVRTVPTGQGERGADTAAGQGGDRLTLEIGATHDITAVYCG